MFISDDLLNPNQKKVLAELYLKRNYDEVWCKPNRGWITHKQLAELCDFKHTGTAIGCLQSFKKQEWVESKKITQLDNQNIFFFRLTNECYQYLRDIGGMQRDSLFGV